MVDDADGRGESAELQTVARALADAVPPLVERLWRGGPGEIYRETLEVLEGSGGEGIILSVGGGVSPGMPRENVVAMLDALKEFNDRRG